MPLILIVVVVLSLILTQALAARESQSPVPATHWASAGMSGVANVNDVEFVGQIGGEVDAVAVQGNYAYYGVRTTIGHFEYF